MKLEVVAVDRLRAPWVRAGVAEYLKRIGRHAPIERKHVKAAGGDDEKAIAEEGRRLLRAAALGSRDRLVTLTPDGESLDSEAWARMLETYAAQGAARIVFVLGGAGGLSPEILEAADRRVSLGPHTLSHELAQLVLFEQIYRAGTILRGEPYHK